MECVKEQGLPVPDKHKQAASFMQPLVDVLLKEIKSRVLTPAASSSADTEKLIRAKAKLATGLTLTPRKPVGDPGAPSHAKISLSREGTCRSRVAVARSIKQTRLIPQIKFASF